MSKHPALNVKFPLMRRFTRILVSVLTLTVFVGVIIVPFEMQAGDSSKIQSMFDGVWWAVTTVTTVGYGDLFPVTMVGRLLGMLLQISGVVMFGSLIGTMTVYLNRAQDEFHWKRSQDRQEHLEDEIKSLNSKLDFLIKNNEKKQRKSSQWGL